MLCISCLVYPKCRLLRLIPRYSKNSTLLHRQSLDTTPDLRILLDPLLSRLLNRSQARNIVDIDNGSGPGVRFNN